MVAFRDHLARHRTLEAAYLDIVRRNLKFPHIFLNQIVHVILRNVLDGCDDAFVLRAAELFFRPQKLTLHEGSLVAADEETVSGLGNKPLSPLVSMLGLPAAAEIDVLNEDNAEAYWERSDLFDMALDLTAGRVGLAALGEVMKRWIAHLLAVEVEIEPLVELQDVTLTWYVGLDADATRIGDALWKGDEVDEADAGTRCRALPADLCRPRGYGGEGQRRAGLSDGCDGGRQGSAPETAEPRDRTSSPPLGGGELNATALVSISRGRRGRTAQGDQPVDRFCLAAGVGACRRAVGGAVDTARPGGRHDDVLRRRRHHRAAPHRDGELHAAIWKPTRRSCGWCCGRRDAEPPYDVMAVTADPAEGEASTEAGNDLDRDRADARQHRRDDCRHSSPSTTSSGRSSNVSATGPDSLPAAKANGRAGNERRREPFVARWSRLKRDTAKETKDKTPADPTGAQAWRSPPTSREPEGAPPCGRRVDGACLRSGKPAVHRVHYGQQRHPRLSANGCAGGIDQGGAAARLDYRPRDSRFYRHRREPVGLHRSHRHAGFRTA